MPVDCRRALAALVPVRPGRQALEVGAGPAGREVVPRRPRHPAWPRSRASTAAADCGAALAALGAPGHPQDAPPRLRRQGPGRRRNGDDPARGVAGHRRRAGRARGLVDFALRGVGARRARRSTASSRSTTARATPTRTASSPLGRAGRDCPLPTVAEARATSPARSPRRSTTSACWRSRCSTSATARRPSGCWSTRSRRACTTPATGPSTPARSSQFENHIRAIAGWPLGATERHSRCRDAQPDRRRGATTGRARRRARRAACTSTASARRGRAARWATSRGSRQRPRAKTT